MLNEISAVKRKLDDSITQLCDVSWMFSKNPERDFTRNRKLSLQKVISILLSMEGGSLTTELNSFFTDLRQYRTILSAILRSKIFRQMKQKTQLILCVSASIFVIYGGKDSSKIALKVPTANCAVLP